MGNYQILEHTADMGIEAWGESSGEMFVQAARGLMDIIGGETETLGEERLIEIRGEDFEEILIRWLNEILFLFESRGFFPGEFEIMVLEDHFLRARVMGEQFDSNRHRVEREVKAVTYHQLKVEKSGNEWRARIYLDL